MGPKMGFNFSTNQNSGGKRHAVPLNMPVSWRVWASGRNQENSDENDGPKNSPKFHSKFTSKFIPKFIQHSPKIHRKSHPWNLKIHLKFHAPINRRKSKGSRIISGTRLQVGPVHDRFRFTTVSVHASSSSIGLSLSSSTWIHVLSCFFLNTARL